MSSGFQPTLSFLCDQSNDCAAEDDRVIVLKSRLENDPYNYNLHLDLVDYLQNHGNPQQLRKARENMQSIFPLSSALWLRWLEDELKPDANHQPLVDTINELFEKALLDQPFSPEIWLQYLKYSSNHLTAIKMRDLFERAIFKAGYNLISGYVIFQYLGEYLLKDPTINQQTVKVSENKETYLSDLYAVRLKIPHLDATLSAFDDYENFNKQHGLPINLPLTQEHTKIIDVYTTIEHQLRALSENPIETNFRELIEFFSADNDALDCIDNNLIVEAIYELFLSFNEVNIDLWKEYIGFISKSHHQRICKVYERAVRFVPWDAVIWCNYLFFCSDKMSDSTTAKLEKVLNNALNVGFNFPEQHLLLYQAYICHFIKHGSNEQVMEAIQKAAEFFIKTYGDQSPSLMFLYELKGDYLLSKEENAIKYIDFWDSLLELEDEEQDNYGRKHFPAHIWINYVKQLLNLELIDKALEVMNASVSRVAGSDLSTLVGSYFNFKLLFGEQGPELVAIDFASNINSAFSSIVQYNWLSAYKQPGERSKKIRDTTKKDQFKKPQKRTKPINTKSTVDDDGFKVPTKSAKLPTSNEPSSKQTAPKPTKLKSETSEVSNLNSVEKIPKERKERTIFLSNISFEVGEDILSKLFEECGEVVEVRLAKSRTSRSKGYGYLEFATVESTKKALLLDRTLVSNRPLFVSPCIDKTNNESLPFKYNTDLTENILFVTKLSRETTLEKLKEVFNELSDGIKEIRLVTNRSGKSKGYAYLDLIDSTTASKAILMYDGMVIDGATISIAKSNPPKRKEMASKNPTQSTTSHPKSSHFPPKNDNLSRQKPRLMCVDNIANKQQEALVSEEPDSNGKSDTKRTNNYFKNLFK